MYASCVKFCRAGLIYFAIAVTPSLANVIVNAQPNLTLPESTTGTQQLNFTIVNTGPGMVTIGTVSTSFMPQAGDTTNDAIDLIGDDGACDNKVVLVGVANACIFHVGFDVLDHDPFDMFNKTVDSGMWFIQASVPFAPPATPPGSPVPAGILITIADDSLVPEPNSMLLLVTGGICILIAGGIIRKKAGVWR